MLNPPMTVLHRHGDDWEPMEEVEPTAVDHDLERRLLRGERIFRCESCDEEISIVSAADET